MKLPKGLTITDDSGHNIVVGRLYNTDIVHYRQAWLTLRHGGWLTKHTKKCINLILDHYKFGLTVTQVKGEWIVSNKDGRSVPFVDGMRISI